jgi:hypothetical protein
VIKTSKKLGLSYVNSNRERQEIRKKQDHVTPPKLNNSTITNTNNSEVDEAQITQKNDYQNDQGHKKKRMIKEIKESLTKPLNEY